MDLNKADPKRLDTVYKKVTWRLLPFLLLCYFLPTWIESTLDLQNTSIQEK